MSKTIHAVFAGGVFRPTEPVDLPDGTEVDIHTPDPQAKRATWDEIFATKLVIGSTPADDKEDDFEVTGDDLLC
jgi:predicted DNA-binding antitoxin AbrB/MazE fold protein